MTTKLANSVDLTNLNLNVDDHIKYNMTPSKIDQVNNLISATKSSEPTRFQSLDDTRLILNNLVLNKKISKELTNKGTVDDGLISITPIEIRKVIIDNYFDNFLKHMSSNMNYKVFIDICNSVDYKINRELTTIDLKTDSKMVYSNQTNSKKVDICSEIFRQEMWITENVVPKYMYGCMKHIAMQIWLQSSVDEKLKIIESNSKILNFINTIETDKSNPYHLFKVQASGKYENFMINAGYEESHEFGNNIVVWKLKVNAWEKCYWVRNNYNHKNPIIVSKYNYSNSDKLTQIAVLMHMWRRFQTHKNAIPTIIETIG